MPSASHSLRVSALVHGRRVRPAGLPAASPAGSAAPPEVSLAVLRLLAAAALPLPAAAVLPAVRTLAAALAPPAAEDVGKVLARRRLGAAFVPAGAARRFVGVGVAAGAGAGAGVSAAAGEAGATDGASEGEAGEGETGWAREAATSTDEGVFIPGGEGLGLGSER